MHDNQSSDIFDQFDTEILSIGVFPLHITPKGIQAGVTKLNFHVDSFAIDINFFFKLSAAHRANYTKIEELTDFVSKVLFCSEVLFDTITQKKIASNF